MPNYNLALFAGTGLGYGTTTGNSFVFSSAGNEYNITASDDDAILSDWTTGNYYGTPTPGVSGGDPTSVVVASDIPGLTIGEGISSGRWFTLSYTDPVTASSEIIDVFLLYDDTTSTANPSGGTETYVFSTDQMIDGVTYTVSNVNEDAGVPWTAITPPDGIVDGEATDDVMAVGYDDAGQATDNGGDQVTNDADVIEGNAGNDSINAGAGDDTVDGGADNDTLEGGGGDDSLLGGAGDDTLYGNNATNSPESPGPELLTNGSFEDGIHAANDADGLTGWSNSVGSPDAADDGGTSESWNPANEASDGTGYVTMWAYSTGPQEALEQTLTTPLIGGETYSLTFDAISADQDAATGTWFTPKDIPVSFEILDASTGTVLGSIIVQGTDYESYTFDFTPPSDVTTISLRPNTAGQGDYPSIILDNVSLKATSTASPDEDDTLDGGDGDDALFGQDGSDSLVGGTGEDTLDGGSDNDTLTGGAEDDTFIVSNGTDTITDFGVGDTGPIDDGDQSNNDFVDLSGHYSLANYNAAVAAGHLDPAVIKNPIQWLQADQADGVLDDTYAGWDATNTLSINNGGVAVASTDLTFDNTNVACFTRGTMIATRTGLMAIEALKAGDQVMTMDNGYQKVAWIGTRRLDASDLEANPKLRPIRIAKGALAEGMPEHDLTISPQHRMLARSVIAERVFGEEEVLISAKKLTILDGIDVVEDVGDVEYFHILFSNHEVVFANGAPSESLFTGREALKSLSREAYEEITTLFPDMLLENYNPLPARHIPKYGKLLKTFAYRHKLNQKPLIQNLRWACPSDGKISRSSDIDVLLAAGKQ